MEIGQMTASFYSTLWALTNGDIYFCFYKYNLDSICNNIRIVFSILFLESRHQRLRTLKIYIMFGPPRGARKTYQLMHIANTISHLLEDTVRFVHNVSQLRTGKNVKYYTMMLQFPDKNYRTVSYRKVFNDQFPKTAQNESQWKW